MLYLLLKNQWHQIHLKQILVYKQYKKTETPSTLKLDVMTGDALSMVLALGQIGWWRYYRLRLPYSILN